MKVTLNIDNDKELRAYIKEQIKNQVISIVREDFLQIVMEELQRKVKGLSEDNFNRMFKNALENCISDILHKEHGVFRWNSQFIAPYINAKLDETLKGTNWNKLVDDLAKEKVKSLIK